MNLREVLWGAWTELIWIKMGTGEYKNEPMGSINCGKFLDWTRTFWFLRKDSAPWN
jgi:hypothetical protein